MASQHALCDDARACSSCTLSCEVGDLQAHDRRSRLQQRQRLGVPALHALVQRRTAATSGVACCNRHVLQQALADHVHYMHVVHRRAFPVPWPLHALLLVGALSSDVFAKNAAALAKDDALRIGLGAAAGAACDFRAVQCRTPDDDDDDAAAVAKIAMFKTTV